MPQRRAAKKALRQSKKKREHNLQTKQNVKDAIKKLKKAVENKDKASSKSTLANVYKTLDKAAAKKTIHKNKAARKKSRLSKLAKEISSK